jgi:hypothetical protein
MVISIGHPPLATIAWKSKISMDRLMDIEPEADIPTQEELEAIAKALGTTVELIAAIQN